MNDANYRGAELDKALSRLESAINAVRGFYDPARAFNVELRINRAFEDIRALYRINQHDIAVALRSCPDPFAINESAPVCDKCPNYTMAPDGRPMCKITRRALE